MPEEQKSYLQHRPHPWHGIDPIVDSNTVRAFIEITQYDRIKFEVDPETGYLCVDRPQRNSSLPPIPYGFVPKTLCGDKTAASLKKDIRGDGDALDICLLSEQEINRAEVVLNARIVGALFTLDDGLADPKLIAVLNGDLLWGNVAEHSDIPSRQIERIEHYFRQYKVEKVGENPVELIGRCGRDKALELLEASLQDYQACYTNP